MNTKKRRNRKYRKRTYRGGDDNDCGICMNPMLDRDTCIANCKHKFHLHCILGWYEKPINIGDNTCPECRGDIRMRRLDDPVVETAADIRRRDRQSMVRSILNLNLSRGRTHREIGEEFSGDEE